MSTAARTPTPRWSSRSRRSRSSPANLPTACPVAVRRGSSSRDRSAPVSGGAALVSSDVLLEEVDLAPHGAAFSLDGCRSLRFDLLPYDNPAYRIVVDLLAAPGTVEVVGLCGNVPVVLARDLAPTGSGLLRGVLEHDQLHGVEIRSPRGEPLAGAVVAVRFYEVVSSILAPGAWTSLTTEAVRLPVSHPDYPCTPRAAIEDVDAEAARARRMVSYGPPAAAVRRGWS